MATKRNTSQPGVTSGAAPARAKSSMTSKHRNPAAAETPTNVTSPITVLEESPRTTPSFDAIAQLAYSYWEARGYQGGSPEEDWLRAEQELVSSLTKSAAN
jgi:hypothetical protein